MKLLHACLALLCVAPQLLLAQRAANAHSQTSPQQGAYRSWEYSGKGPGAGVTVGKAGEMSRTIALDTGLSADISPLPVQQVLRVDRSGGMLSEEEEKQRKRIAQILERLPTTSVVIPPPPPKSEIPPIDPNAETSGVSGVGISVGEVGGSLKPEAHMGDSVRYAEKQSNITRVYQADRESEEQALRWGFTKSLAFRLLVIIASLFVASIMIIKMLIKKRETA